MNGIGLLRVCRLAALFLLGLLVIARVAYPLPTSVRIQAVDAIAFYVPSSTSLDAALENAGYAPPVAPSKEILSNMPDIKKIEAAYLAAEQAHPNQGGADLLALLSAELSIRFPGIREEAALHFLHRRTPTPPLPFMRTRFTGPKPASPIWEAIAKIAFYGYAGLGSQQLLLVRHFNLSDEAAYNMLRSNDTFADALHEAYQVSPANGEKNLRSLAKALARVSPAMRHDAHVAALFPGRTFPPEEAEYASLFRTSPGDRPLGTPGSRPFGSPKPAEPYKPYKPYTPPYKPPPRPIRP